MSRTIKSLLKSPFRKKKIQPPPRPSKSPTRTPKSPNKIPFQHLGSKPPIQISQLQSLPIEIFCKIWNNLGYISASFIKSSLLVSKDVADKIHYCTEKILLDTTDINLTQFKNIKSIKIDYSLNNSQDVKRVSKILTKIGNKVVFDTQWKYIDYEHEDYIYSGKKYGKFHGETSLPYIIEGEKTLLKYLVKQLNMQQLKHLGNSIAISIIHDYNWNRVKYMLDTLFANVSKKQRYTIVCSMIEPWNLYSNGYDHVQRVWFRTQHPKEYAVMTRIPKYLISQVNDISKCKNWDANDFNWS